MEEIIIGMISKRKKRKKQDHLFHVFQEVVGQKYSIDVLGIMINEGIEIFH